ncbi:class I SAM-dependent methyltransferase [Streptomyces sp. HPF1205]|uniref:class I SAM-dependent methyltransferase n=1 Tax=Streptomyces sp. HPF1205 TaxID=2873262 RepID=UPI001CED3EC1|nr:class I SAM-dependent methyltransferase [Streptomyces sp. HPF1205]
MTDTGTYERAWETFWRQAPDEAEGVFWDADASRSAGLHLRYFGPHFDPALPVVDLGCGNGTQTRFLARHYKRAIGVDLTRAAVERAARDDVAGAATYRQLDATDPAAVAALHEETGDVNVYMRGVLHQCRPQDRVRMAEGIATLVGARGRAFVFELAEAAKGVLSGLAQAPAGPPVKLRPVFALGITPADVADDALPRYFADAGLSVLARGELPLATTEFAPDGKPIELPSKWLVAGRPNRAQEV